MTKLPKFVLRTVCLAVCLCGVLALALPAGAVPEIGKAYPQYLYTVPVYGWASENATVIGWLENSAALTVLEDSGDYFMIDCYDMTGYIAKDRTAQSEDKYYVNCDPEDSGLVNFRSAEELQDLRDSLTSLAEQQLGTPYVYGGSQPGGFDCSGLVYYLYGRQGYTLERGASDQMSAGLIVDSDEMEPGDLVFFRDWGSSYLATHVGLYVGDGKMIHAGNSGIGYAELDGYWYAEHFVGARRVVLPDPAEPAEEPEQTEKLETAFLIGAPLRRSRIFC